MGRIEPVTPRLQLRQWQEKGRVPFAAMNADLAVMKKMGMSRDENFLHHRLTESR